MLWKKFINIIHKDINPSNIIWNPQRNIVKIIDFSISTKLSKEMSIMLNPDKLEGTLPYMSPEQTGRINRALDYRTDFYSLGVTFYQMLTKRLPFETKEAMKLIHCHIAKTATPPQIINPEIPSAISEIIMCLMSKNAEERYQSTFGLKEDLKNCLEQLRNKKPIYEFPLRNKKFSDRFRISQKIYGRDEEIAILLEAFNRVMLR